MRECKVRGHILNGVAGAGLGDCALKLSEEGEHIMHGAAGAGKESEQGDRAN